MSDDADHLPPINRESRNEWLSKKEVSTYSLSSQNGNKRYLYELEEQVKVLKEDNRKKDELIQKLSSMEVKETHLSAAPIDSLPSLHYAKGDYAALTVKVETLIKELREMECECELERSKNQHVKKENDAMREEIARQASIIINLHKQVEEVGNKEDAYETLRLRNETAVKTLQEENRQSQTRIIDLESRIRFLLLEREKVEQDKDNTGKTFFQFHSEIIHLLACDADTPTDKLLLKIAEIMSENAALKTKALGLNEAISTAHREEKASRDALQKLMEEIQREKDEFGRQTKTRQEMKDELEHLKHVNDELQKHCNELEQKYESSQREVNTIQGDYRQMEINFIRLKEESKESSYEVNSHKKIYQSLLESLAALLSSAYSHCPSNEAAVKERLRALLADLREKKDRVESLEQQLQSVSRKADLTFDNLRGQELLVKRTEADYLQLTDRVNGLEAELASIGVISSGLKADKEKFIKFMRRLAAALRLNDIKGDTPIDGMTELILKRVESLGRLDPECAQNHAETIHKLKTKVHKYKEVIENKEIAVNMLRQQVRSLKQNGKKCNCFIEDELSSSSDAGEDKTMVDKKLDKALNKLAKVKEENVELKNRLISFESDMYLKSEHFREVSELQSALEKLERVRQKQAEKILAFQRSLSDKEKYVGESRVVAESAVQSLSNELRATNKLLQEAQKRERHLMDFRSVIGRMLGLNLDVLAIPDYEIIHRLELLIQGDPLLPYPDRYNHKEDDHDPPSRSDYDDARRLLGPPPNRSTIKNGHHRHARYRHARGSEIPNSYHHRHHRHHQQQNRAHSVSPDQLDPQRY